MKVQSQKVKMLSKLTDGAEAMSNDGDDKG